MGPFVTIVVPRDWLQTTWQGRGVEIAFEYQSCSCGKIEAREAHSA